MSDSTPKTTAELRTRLDQEWEALEGTLAGLTRRSSPTSAIRRDGP